MLKRYKIERISTSDQPVVDICDLRDQVAVDDTSYDSLLESYELAARELIEEKTRRVLADTVYHLYLDGFPDADFVFLNGPVISIESITYLIDNAYTGTVDTSVYRLGRGSVTSQHIVTNQNSAWPTDGDSGQDIVKISYTAGYTVTPARAVQAIKLLVSHWFEHREAVVSGSTVAKLPHGFDDIIRSMKTYEIV